MQDKGRWLLLILLVSTLLRAGAALALGDQVEVLPGIHDQLSYHTLAVRLLEGHGFTFERQWWPITQAGQPTAHWSYLYTFYLAAIYALFGVHPLAARLLQSILAGLLMPWLTYRLARRVFAGQGTSTNTLDKGQVIALIAAGWVACYGYFIYYSASLMTESFYMLGLLWVIDCALRLSSRPTSSSYHLAFLELGLAIAFTVLLRQLSLLFIPFLFLWLWWALGRRQGTWPALRRVFLGGLLSAAVLAACIAPFTLLNYRQFGRFVLLNTNAGYAFFWGNHPVYGDHFVSILTPEMGSYQELIPEELRSLDEAALDQALLQRGLGFVSTDPGRYLRLSLSRIPAYFWFWPSPDSSLPSNLTRVFSFGLALPFMLVGIGLWVKDLRRKQVNAAPGALLLLFAGVYSAIHLLSWALVRYRLPVDAVLLIFAARALAGPAMKWLPLKRLA
ncbi:MAG: hypothetical protein AB1894_04155 [Chloroflexota bacterium]